jgi:outer membrane lipoprotein-sorting protein
MRRVTVVVTIFVASMATACGGGAGSPPGPPTAKSVAAALKSSSMRNGHFNMRATLANGANRYNATGTGTIQIKPKYGLKANLQVETGTILGTLGLNEIVVDGQQYTQIGTGAWTSQPDKSGSSITNPSRYVGEDIVNGTRAWHVQTQDAGATTDAWVRESDGYLVKMQYAGTDGSAWTLDFDSYNSGGPIVAPTVAPSPSISPAP